MNWTDQDDMQLMQLRKNGTPPREIAKQLGRSLSAVCQRAVRTLGLPTLRAEKRYWSDSEVQTLHEMFPTTRVGAIAEKLRRSEQSVRDRAQNDGLFRRDFPL
tara:strand:- start:1935 stop:2243 length:309 start_codon:yes stop_codon:yes gene_type:complete